MGKSLFATSRIETRMGKSGRNRRINSSEGYEEAVEFSKGFHGREPKAEIEFVEVEKFSKNYGILGVLHEIKIVLDYDELTVIPIQFCKVDDKNHPVGNEKNWVQLCAASAKPGLKKEKKSLFCKGGIQKIDLNKLVGYRLLEEGDLDKKYITIGAAYSVTYCTDKHHLTGPEYQKKGAGYEHVFGEEENGEFPLIIYDGENDWVLWSGGSYEIRDEGIFN